MTPSEYLLGLFKPNIQRIFQFVIQKNYLPTDFKEIQVWDILPKNATFWTFVSIGLILAVFKTLWGISWCCKKCKKSTNSEGHRYGYFCGLFVFVVLLVLATLGTVFMFAANKVLNNGIHSFPQDLESTNHTFVQFLSKLEQVAREDFPQSLNQEIKKETERIKMKFSGLFDPLDQVQKSLEQSKNYSTDLQGKLGNLKANIQNNDETLLDKITELESELNLNFTEKLDILENLKNFQDLELNVNLGDYWNQWYQSLTSVFRDRTGPGVIKFKNEVWPQIEPILGWMHTGISGVTFTIIGLLFLYSVGVLIGIISKDESTQKRCGANWLCTTTFLFLFISPFLWILVSVGFGFGALTDHLVCDTLRNPNQSEFSDPLRDLLKIPELGQISLNTNYPEIIEKCQNSESLLEALKLNDDLRHLLMENFKSKINKKMETLGLSEQAINDTKKYLENLNQQDLDFDAKIASLKELLASETLETQIKEFEDTLENLKNSTSEFFAEIPALIEKFDELVNFKETFLQDFQMDEKIKDMIKNSAQDSINCSLILDFHQSMENLVCGKILDGFNGSWGGLGLVLILVIPILLLSNYLESVMRGPSENEDTIDFMVPPAQHIQMREMQSRNRFSTSSRESRNSLPTSNVWV